MSVTRLAPGVPDPKPIAEPMPNFDELYDSYFDFVWRTLRRLGIRAENLADAAQDVFMVVSRRLQDLHSAEAARSWVYGIVVRVAHEHRRAQLQLVRQVEASEELAQPFAPNAQDNAERREEVALLDRLLGSLDEEKREAFVLVELEQLSVPEVAAMTGHNVNTIYTRLRAARAAFDAALARHRAKERGRG